MPEQTQRITTFGSTLLVGDETIDTPGRDAWDRALAHAEAKARTIAAAAGMDLGSLVEVEEIAGNEGATTGVLVRATFSSDTERAEVASEGAGETARLPVGPDDILDSVVDYLRPVYARFREGVLALSPELRPAPSPLKNGKRRYEGFRMKGRNVIYAGFRTNRIHLRFEIPAGHGLAPEDFITQGGRDWRLVDLTSANQIDGALLLARDTVIGFEP